MNNQEVDELILSVASANWQKVAMVLVKAMGERASNADYEELARGVERLVREGRLESKGDISRWRYSEVRLAMP